MDSLYPVFFELLKVSGVKAPTQDLLFPFVMAIMIGFIMGAITAFTITKIASLEKKNKKIIQKLESSMNLQANLTSSPAGEKKATEEKQDTADQSPEKIQEINQKASTPEPKREEKKKMKSKANKDNTQEIKPDPDFKPPEVRERTEVESEWTAVKKKHSKKPR